MRKNHQAFLGGVAFVGIFFLFFSPQEVFGGGKTEIFVDGKKYGSLQEYREAVRAKSQEAVASPEDQHVADLIKSVIDPLGEKESFSKKEVEAILGAFYQKVVSDKGTADNDLQKIVDEYTAAKGGTESYTVDPAKVKTVILKKEKTP